MAKKSKHSALLDGVLSRSSEHIHMLIQSTDKDVIANTVAALSRQPEAIQTFVCALSTYLVKHPYSARSVLLWLSVVLRTHYSVISSSPTVTDALRDLKNHLSERSSRLVRLNRLKGKVNLLMQSCDATAAPKSSDGCGLTPLTLGTANASLQYSSSSINGGTDLQRQQVALNSSSLYQIEDSSSSEDEEEGESEMVLRMAGKHFSDSELEDDEDGEEADVRASDSELDKDDDSSMEYLREAAGDTTGDATALSGMEEDSDYDESGDDNIS